MRFVAFGDLHLQSSNRRNPDRLKAFDQIIVAGMSLRDLGAWLVLGDVFHARSSVEDRNDVSARFQMMADVAPVAVVYGNHCAPGDLDILGKLKARWPIYVAARPGVLKIPLATGDTAALACVPFPHRAGMVAAGTPSAEIPALARQALDVICMGLAAEQQEMVAAGWVPLLIGHGTLAGSISSAGQPMGLEHDIAFDEQMLNRFGDIPKLFGHIHKPQAMFGAYYSGSISANDWSETENKRWLEIEMQRDGSTWEYRVGSRPIETPKLYHAEGELTRDGFRWGLVGKSSAGPLECEFPEIPESFAGCDVRVRYRFSFDEKTALDETLVRTPFEGARRLELDPIAVRTRASRAPDVAAATTLDEKVAVFATRSGLSWDESLDAKLSALQNPDGAAFLSSIYNSLSGAAAEVCSAATDSSVTSAETGSHATVSAEPAPGNELSVVLL